MARRFQKYPKDLVEFPAPGTLLPMECVKYFSSVRIRTQETHESSYNVYPNNIVKYNNVSACLMYLPPMEALLHAGKP